MREWLFVLGVCFATAGCAPRPTEATSDSPYGQLFGKRFRTTTDLYLFQEVGEPNFKYFGVSGNGVVKPPYLPVAMSRENAGRTFGTANILDVVPAGSEFVVEGATHEVSVPSGEKIGLWCRLYYGGHEVALVNAEYIQKHATDNRRPNPDIDPRYGVPVTRLWIALRQIAR